MCAARIIRKIINFCWQEIFFSIAILLKSWEFHYNSSNFSDKLLVTSSPRNALAKIVRFSKSIPDNIFSANSFVRCSLSNKLSSTRTISFCLLNGDSGILNPLSYLFYVYVRLIHCVWFYAVTINFCFWGIGNKA